MPSSISFPLIRKAHGIVRGALPVSPGGASSWESEEGEQRMVEEVSIEEKEEGEQRMVEGVSSEEKEEGEHPSALASS